jgi:hypothetical protein
MFCGTHLAGPDPDAVDAAGTTGDGDAGTTGDGDADDGPPGFLGIDPDGRADATLTRGVAVAAGLVVGAFVTLAALFATGDARGLLPGPVAGIVTGVHVGRRGSVRVAVTHGAYALAVAVLLFPTFLLGPAVEGGSFGGRVVLFVVVEAFVAVVAGVVALAGYAATHDLTDLLG